MEREKEKMERDRYDKLAEARNNKAKRDFVGSEANHKDSSYAKHNSRASFRKKRTKKDALKKGVSMAKNSLRAGQVLKEINFSEDGLYFVIIKLSIVADIFTFFLPVIGIPIAIVFSVVIWTLYFFTGALKNRAQVKIAVNGIGQALEIFGLGLEMLPFFTTAALVNYWLVLAEKRAEKDNKRINSGSKLPVNDSRADDYNSNERRKAA